jgi:hypothetical protein
VISHEKWIDANKSGHIDPAGKLADSLSNHVDDYEPLESIRPEIKKKIADKLKLKVSKKSGPE